MGITYPYSDSKHPPPLAAASIATAALGGTPAAATAALDAGAADDEVGKGVSCVRRGRWS